MRQQPVCEHKEARVVWIYIPEGIEPVDMANAAQIEYDCTLKIDDKLWIGQAVCNQCNLHLPGYDPASQKAFLLTLTIGRLEEVKHGKKTDIRHSFAEED